MYASRLSSPSMASDHRLLAAAVLVTACVAAGQDVGGGGYVWLAHLLPLAAIVIPLLTGRYIGEQRLASLAGTCDDGLRQATTHTVPRRATLRCLPRGGCLIASFLAVRSPPQRGA